MAAGVLMLSSMSVFANVNWKYEEKHGSNFNFLKNQNLLETASTSIPSAMNVFWFDNNGNSSITMKRANRGTEEAPDWCIEVVSTENNDYLKYSTTSHQHTKMSADIMISGNGGLRLRWLENKNSQYTQEKDIMEFKADGTIAVWEAAGYSSSARVTWEKNKWYNISLVYDKTGNGDGAPFVFELREGSASGKLINSWIGLSGIGTGNISNGNSVACFVTQGATTFYLDNPSFGFMSDATVSPKNYDDPSPYTIAKFVADGKVVNDIASMQGKKVYAEFSVKDTDLTATASKLLIAAYNEDGKLQAVDMSAAFLDDAKLSSAIIDVPADAAEVKMFVWDFGTGLMKPLKDAIVVNK